MRDYRYRSCQLSCGLAIWAHSIPKRWRYFRRRSASLVIWRPAPNMANPYSEVTLRSREQALPLQTTLTRFRPSEDCRKSFRN
jgi:hypothetical protein